MELFIKYQIPTDLLSFSVDTGGATNSERVSAVTASVKAMKVCTVGDIDFLSNILGILKTYPYVSSRI